MAWESGLRKKYKIKLNSSIVNGILNGTAFTHFVSWAINVCGGSVTLVSKARKEVASHATEILFVCTEGKLHEMWFRFWSVSDEGVDECTNWFIRCRKKPLID